VILNVSIIEMLIRTTWRSGNSSL